MNSSGIVFRLKLVQPFSCQVNEKFLFEGQIKMLKSAIDVLAHQPFRH